MHSGLASMAMAAMSGVMCASQKSDDSDSWHVAGGRGERPIDAPELSHSLVSSGVVKPERNEEGAEPGDPRFRELCERIGDGPTKKDIELRGLLKNLLDAGLANADTLEKTLPLLMANKRVDADSIKDLLGLPRVEELLENGKLAHGIGKGLYRLIQSDDEMDRFENLLGMLKSEGLWEREGFRMAFGEWLCMQARKREYNLQHMLVLLGGAGLLEAEGAKKALLLEMKNVIKSRCGNTKHLKRFLEMLTERGKEEDKERELLNGQKMGEALKGGIQRAVTRCNVHDLQNLLELPQAEGLLAMGELKEPARRGAVKFTAGCCYAEMAAFG